MRFMGIEIQLSLKGTGLGGMCFSLAILRRGF